MTTCFQFRKHYITTKSPWVCLLTFWMHFFLKLWASIKSISNLLIYFIIFLFLILLYIDKYVITNYFKVNLIKVVIKYMKCMAILSKPSRCLTSCDLRKSKARIPISCQKWTSHFNKTMVFILIAFAMTLAIDLMLL